MKISRREILAAMAASPLLGMAWPTWAEEKSSIALSSDAVLIDGKPRFLLGGSMDYFRCPRELWRDRLLKAKRAGINTIMTCIAWNFHEQEEGKFDFTGDRDLGCFLDTCHELGLFVFVRLGPFICDEWEFGGHPAWLVTKGISELRTTDAVAMPFIRRWFEKVIPIIAARQVTRGGPVVFAQQDNEYLFVGRPQRKEYQDFLIRTMRELGIEVPITDCNGFDMALRRPESLQTLNRWSAVNVQRLRKTQPGKPVMISEFYTGWLDCWGQDYIVRPNAEEMRQQTFDCIAAGAMPFYFMFHGGTNFGFQASRSSPWDYSFVLPHYYPNGAIAEGGSLNPMYFAIKKTTLPAQSLEKALAGSRQVEMPVKLEGSAQGMARTGELGTLLFLSEKSSKDKQTAKDAVALTSPAGKRFELAASLPAILPWELRLDDKRKIDFANAALVAVSSTAVVVAGEEGRQGVISINGQSIDFRFAADPQVHKANGQVVLAVPSSLSPRTWLAEDRIFVGPAYVGEQRGERHECWCDEKTKEVRVLSPEGSLKLASIPAQPKEPKEISLANWQGTSFPELRGEGKWRELKSPQAVEFLHADIGYTWYRASYKCDKPRQSSLMFTDATDRVHVYQNGKRVGLFGRGAEASRDPLSLNLEAGENHFVFLCDNMGRTSEGVVMDPKGIVGPVYVDSKQCKIKWNQETPPRNPPEKSWRYLTFKARQKPKAYSRHSGEFTVEAGQTLVVSLRDFSQFVWISLNGKPLGELAGNLTLCDGAGYCSFVVDQALAGTTQVELLTFGDPLENPAEHVKIFACPQASALTDWGFRAWSEPASPIAVVKDQPACWKTEFARPKVSGPLFFESQGLSKGQIFLNGRAVSRYWHIGPQKRFYIPEPWRQEKNELIIFDEEGNQPTNARLIVDEQYPTQMFLA